MKKNSKTIQENCEKYIFTVADNIERLLNEKKLNLNKLIVNAEIEGIDDKEKQLFKNLIYSFMQKVSRYKKSTEAQKSIPYIAYSTLVTFADYLDVNVSELLEEPHSKTLQLPLYYNTEDSVKTIKISKELLNDATVNENNIFAVKVINASMKPVINTNNIVFAIKEGKYFIDGLYVIKTDSGYYPKRIMFHTNTIDVISDNSAYKTISYITQDNNVFYNKELNESIIISGRIISIINKSINLL